MPYHNGHSFPFYFGEDRCRLLPHIIATARDLKPVMLYRFWVLVRGMLPAGGLSSRGDVNVILFARFKLACNFLVQNFQL